MARDLENQVLYSVDIGDRDSSLVSDDYNRSASDRMDGVGGNENRLVCGYPERRLMIVMKVCDLFTVIRIPAVIVSLFNTRGLRCYFEFRTISMYIFLVAWIFGISALLLAKVDENESVDSGTIVGVGFGGGLLLILDLYANLMLKRHFLRVLRKEKVHFAKLKGRMLS